MSFMKNILKEFESFALKGSVIDLAVAIVVGTAFNRVVSSLVNDMILPPLGLLLGRVKFSSLQIALYHPEGGEVIALRYGQFLQTILDFFVIAFSVFVVIKFFNRLIARDEKGKKS